MHPTRGSFTPDGRHAVWAGQDGVIRMYRLPAPDQGKADRPRRRLAGRGPAAVSALRAPYRLCMRPCQPLGHKGQTTLGLGGGGTGDSDDDLNSTYRRLRRRSPGGPASAGLAWIVMGLLTLLTAWSMSDYASIDGWWEFVRIEITVPVLMLELVFGLALICAGIFAWRMRQIGPHMSASDWAIPGSSARSLSSFPFSRSPYCRSPWGTARSGWRIPDGGAATPPRRAWEGGIRGERTGPRLRSRASPSVPWRASSWDWFSGTW